ncbi:carboxypeptidase regulatory-like domain-containing protein [Pedosphaera parvula]|uniref:Blue (Type 1) copper domain protein n=1 Tax=Pedosphaera parvula (strain Ellin514) TaxID=320771 RepID=B9XK46_PEDPL|nr:carboxypeptidase regulatory-like domain-containing protein [Pedosphaera parvula]EEF59869.1 blue (type 1) copper domain protein [Pedosphaera parvula Ellin514]
MKRFILFLLIGEFVAGTLKAGTIVGTVHAEGRAEAGQSMQGGKYDSHALKHAEKVDYAGMRDFVIYIEGLVGTNQAAPSKPVQVVTQKRVSQKGATFAPHVLPIVKNTTVEWPNNDDILHNVFSYSEAKPFDLDLYGKGESKHVLFDTVGQVDVFCSIHSSMSCVVLVLENPYFATSEKGTYRITDVPAGTYKLVAWHERMPKEYKTITVPENGEVKLDFTLGIKNLPKY